MISQMLLVASLAIPILSYAKLDPQSEAVSRELSQNADIRKCYLASESQKTNKKQLVIVNIRLAKDGNPTLVSAIQNPDQSKDTALNGCIENTIRTLRFPVQAKSRIEVQVQLAFPTK